MSFTLSAFAGNGTGKIGRILVQEPHYVFFSVVNSAPFCQGNSTEFVIDVSKGLGHARYSLIMMVKGLTNLFFPLLSFINGSSSDGL